MIPNINGKNLYIECNGERWHGKDRAPRDRAKATFLSRYIPNSDLITLWEFEYRSVEKIKKILCEKFGVISYPTVLFDFKDVIIIYKGEETNYYMHDKEILESFGTPTFSKGTKA